MFIRRKKELKKSFCFWKKDITKCFDGLVKKNIYAISRKLKGSHKIGKKSYLRIMKILKEN